MSGGHWPRMARFWSLVGPPLRPGPADIAVFQRAVDSRVAGLQVPPRALILGVTPELYGLRWPAGATLRALDSSPEMIAAVWPGPPGSALPGSWTTMPLADGSCDVVLCDGGFGMLPYPEGQASLLREVQRVLAPGGIFAVRLFAPVGRTGRVEEILADLEAGRIASLDALKLRLWGALHGKPGEGVRPRDVVACILAAAGSYDRLAAQHGWPPEHVRTLEMHRESAASYHLTDAAAVAHMAQSGGGGFDMTEVLLPDHEFGASCPLLVLHRSARLG